MRGKPFFGYAGFPAYKATPPDSLVLAASLINPQQSEKKIMRKALSISALILALTHSAYAGDMPNGVPGTPQPTPTPAVQGPTVDDQIETGVTATTVDGDLQSGAAITLMQMVLNLLALS